MDRLHEELYKERDLSDEDLRWILQCDDPRVVDELYRYADETRRRYYGDKVYIRGLIEISSYCKNTCMYCGLRRQNAELTRYRMTEGEVIACCALGYALGFRTFVLQGGEDAQWNDDRLEELIIIIKRRCPDVAVTLSLGEMPRESYQRLYDAGADRYLLRHEAANKLLYQAHHPTMSHENRLRCLSDLKAIGYQSGSGFIVGLKGQGVDELVEDLRYLQSTQPHMIGLGPFIPHGDTPLADCPMGSFSMTLKLMALVRLLVPDCLMPVTTALSVLHPKDGITLGLRAGANVIMPNLTPKSYREGYQIYDGKSRVSDIAQSDLMVIEKKIHQAGYTVDMSRGDHVYATGRRI